MKLAVRIAVGLLIVAALVTAYAYFPFRENLSHLEVPQGTYDVEILRDTYGVPHVFGVTDADVAFGIAYANA
ncbi:MAG: penicillin acylase family protein, partial [Chloroflexota bacterium]